MANAVTRWGVPLASLLLVGPLAAAVTSSMTAPDGFAHTPGLLSAAPLLGILKVILAILIAAAAGLIASRLLTPGWGLFCTGAVLAWAAWPTGTIDDVFRRTHTHASIWSLALEGAIVAAVTTAAAWGVIAAGKRPGAPEPATDPSTLGTGFITCVLVGLGAAWLVAQEALKGQGIGAAAVAGIAAGLAARSAAPRCPSAVFVLALLALAVISPIAAALLHAADLPRAVFNATLFNPAKVMPLDWAAGALIGLPIGLSWSGGMLEDLSLPLAPSTPTSPR